MLVAVAVAVGKFGSGIRICSGYYLFVGETEKN